MATQRANATRGRSQQGVEGRKAQQPSKIMETLTPTTKNQLLQ
jgi:hypothetical protein